MEVKSLNSIVFHTQNLEEIKSFYNNILFLEIAEFENEGKVEEDQSDKHINYLLGEVLLCFEKGDRTDNGTIILNVDNLKESKELIKNLEIKIQKENDDWAIIKDPDGRAIILE